MNRGESHHHGHGTDPRPDDGSNGESGNDSGEHKGHDRHAGQSPKMFRDKFWLSFALAVPVVFWSAHFQELLVWQLLGANINFSIVRVVTVLPGF